MEIAAGYSDTQTYNINNVITLHVIIDSVSFDGTLLNNPLSNQRLVGYSSGGYGGDGLVQLYNIGVPNNGANTIDRSQNTLYNALSLKIDGDFSGTPDEAKANYRIRAYAYLTATSEPIDVGMIFADAETDEPEPLWPYWEYSQGTTSGTPWQVFETGLLDPDGWQRLDISNSGMTARTLCGFNGFVFNPGNVILMYTKAEQTTLTNPLKVDMELLGGGNAATALGFVITESDKGDAPMSYGLAENLKFATVTGGTQPNDGTYYISNSGLFGGTPILDVGNYGYPNTPRLGALPGDPDDYTTITGVNADFDNVNGANDEDALSSVPELNTRDNTYSLTFDATPSTGQNAYINAWIDLNGNGTFDASEYQATTINSSGQVTLTWNGITPKVSTSYIRLRIQSNVVGSATGSFDTKVEGETEDYRIDITTFISGNVFHDENGNNGTPFNTVDGTPIYEIGTNQIYVSLLDSLGNLVTQVPVQSNGTYEIPEVTIGEYDLVITTTPNGITPSLPNGWVNSGENIGSGVGNDGNPDGKISIVVNQGEDEKVNVNFGIQQRPIADEKEFSIAESGFTITPTSGYPYEYGYKTIPMNSTLLTGYSTGGSLSGSDPEDCTAASSCNTGTNSTFNIETINSNTKLYYDFGGIIGIIEIDLMSGPVAIENFDMDKLVIYGLVGNGTAGNEIGFTYSITDLAGATSTPVQYSIETITPLPISLINFDVVKQNKVSVLQWNTASEQNNRGFAIERSTDSKTWTQISFVASQTENGNSKTKLTYTYTDLRPETGKNYYRLKQTDFDDKFGYSGVEMVEFESIYGNIFFYPNPTESKLSIIGISGNNQIRLVDNIGRIVYAENVKNMQGNHSIDMSSLPLGLYYISIINEKGEIITEKVQKL